MPDLPEQQARANIDAMLTAAGWAVQDYKAFNPSPATGVALREVPLKSGRCDYLLLVNRKPLGVVEAKKEGVKHTTNLASTSMFNLKSLPIPIQPPSKQVRIVAELERRLSVVEELEAVVTANLQRATRLRQSILQNAFAGNLT